MNHYAIDTSFIPNLPDGPLREYRQRAQFDWKQLRVYLEGEDGLRAKYMIWNYLENDPIFKKPLITLPVDEQKRLAAIQVNRIMEHKFLPKEIKNAPYQKRVG